jgi:poly(hydroxyalkanoate) depolymerase family esterase
MLDLMGQTTAGLDQFRRQWQELLGSAANDTVASRLVAVTDLEPAPGNLRMLTYVPSDLPPRAPLVVVLHGCVQTAAEYDHGSGWSTLADAHGFALLLPEQARTNHPNCCFNWYELDDTERDRGEALAIRRMIERMLVDHDLDRRRVYVTGLSAGGAMTSVMLATYPELFAGGAILAGLPYRSAIGVREAMDSMADGYTHTAPEWADLVRAASEHQGPWPRVSIWHGDADATVAPGNAQEIVKQWVGLHGLELAPTSEETVAGAQRSVWRDAKGRDVVELHLVPGMGHGAPVDPGEGDGHAGAVGPFMLDAGISSTWHIARFWGLTKRRHRASTVFQPDGAAIQPRDPSTKPARATSVNPAADRQARTATTSRPPSSRIRL